MSGAVLRRVNLEALLRAEGEGDSGPRSPAPPTSSVPSSPKPRGDGRILFLPTNWRAQRTRIHFSITICHLKVTGRQWVRVTCPTLRNGPCRNQALPAFRDRFPVRPRSEVLEGAGAPTRPPRPRGWAVRRLDTLSDQSQRGSVAGGSLEESDLNYIILKLFSNTALLYDGRFHVGFKASASGALIKCSFLNLLRAKSAFIFQENGSDLKPISLEEGRDHRNDVECTKNTNFHKT